MVTRGTLVPVSFETVELPSGSRVEIPKAEPIYKPWVGQPVSDEYGHKTVLDLRGEPAFAELVILALLHDEGREGIWVDTYRHQYRTRYFPKNAVDLPPASGRPLEEIYRRANSRKGCWDVFCWKDGGDYLFAEAKRHQRDSIRDSQRQWLEACDSQKPHTPATCPEPICRLESLDRF